MPIKEVYKWWFNWYMLGQHCSTYLWKNLLYIFGLFYTKLIKLIPVTGLPYFPTPRGII